MCLLPSAKTHISNYSLCYALHYVSYCTVLVCADAVLALDKLVSPACLCISDILLQSMSLLQCRELELIALSGAALVYGHYE